MQLVVVKKGEQEIPGLTDENKPRRLGPKRASKIRKLFGCAGGGGGGAGASPAGGGGGLLVAVRVVAAQPLRRSEPHVRVPVPAHRGHRRLVDQHKVKGHVAPARHVARPPEAHAALAEAHVRDAQRAAQPHAEQHVRLWTEAAAHHFGARLGDCRAQPAREQPPRRRGVATSRRSPTGC